MRCFRAKRAPSPSHKAQVPVPGILSLDVRVCACVCVCVRERVWKYVFIWDVSVVVGVDMSERVGGCVGVGHKSNNESLGTSSTS